MSKIAYLIGSLTVMASGIVSAHPGHGMEFAHTHDLLHPFLGSAHVMLLGAIGLVAMCVRALNSSDHDGEE